MAINLETLQVKANQQLKDLDVELSKYKFLNDIEAKTKVKKTHVALGLAAVLFIMVFFNLAGGLITNTIGWLYPGKFFLSSRRSVWFWIRSTPVRQVWVCVRVWRGKPPRPQRVYRPNDGLKSHNDRTRLGDDQTLHRHTLCWFSIWFHRTLGIMRHGSVYAPIFNQNPWILKPRRVRVSLTFDVILSSICFFQSYWDTWKDWRYSMAHILDRVWFRPNHWVLCRCLALLVPLLVYIQGSVLPLACTSSIPGKLMFKRNECQRNGFTDFIIGCRVLVRTFPPPCLAQGSAWHWYQTP